MRPWRILTLGAALWLSSGAHAQNCCMPKVEDDENQASAKLVEGIQSATAVLLVAPGLLVAGLGIWLYRTHRSSARLP